MTTDPRVEAAAREMHRLEYGGATDWDADGSLHSAFYLAAESILAAADAALADAPSGFFAGLTDQQQADALAYRGPENHGRDDRHLFTGRAVCSGSLNPRAVRTFEGGAELSDWQPISTYKPTPFQVLCAHAEKRWMRFGQYAPEMRRWYYSGTNERSQWAQVDGDEPTHWMPTPELPAGAH